MFVDVDRKEIREVNKTAIIQQTAFWSEVKQKQGIGTKAFNFKVKNTDLFHESKSSQYIVHDLLILLQHINREDTIAYVPYGPEIEPSEENQGQFLEELSEALRTFLPPKCIMIRYDLAWQSHWAKEHTDFDYKGIWNGPPEKKYQQFRLNFNTRNWNLKKANSDILPSNTIFLDLEKGQDNLLEKMKPKTKYNIRLSHRKGVSVKKIGLEDLDIWYELYKQTALRNRIHLNGIEYFRTVLMARANDTCSPAEVELLLAELDGLPLAAMFLVISGNRATYLYGASASSNRNYMATYALQWDAISRAQQKGCTEYDLFGVAPRPDPSHPMYGLYKFKTGFGGDLYHRMGCWDYPLDHEKYSLYVASEMNSQGYHL
ncbi:MAG TPA: peptidoglycan bridge formation glycyltransferase FemA/FemB family protein [Daejeonella sp.]|nr:peptidoglycan bridge formation glycyltransferase FemA/FemB family protein [Daejeonella sp.]